MENHNNSIPQSLVLLAYLSHYYVCEARRKCNLVQIFDLYSKNSPLPPLGIKEENRETKAKNSNTASLTNCPLFRFGEKEINLIPLNRGIFFPIYFFFIF
jgi:hypothetical protein